MMTKVSAPIWQRVFCALFSAGGAVALVANVLDGSVHGIWGIATWVLGLFGAVTFGRIAVHKPTVHRGLDALPVPSSQVSHLIEEHRQVEAIKAYRAETSASFFEAKAVIEQHWPTRGPPDNLPRSGWSPEANHPRSLQNDARPRHSYVRYFAAVPPADRFQANAMAWLGSFVRGQTSIFVAQ